MKPSRFTEEQIIGILQEQEAGANSAGTLNPIISHVLVWLRVGAPTNFQLPRLRLRYSTRGGRAKGHVREDFY